MMKMIVLAAGFATRLHPLTIDRPKPLLPVGPRGGSDGKPLIEHVLDAALPIPEINQVYVVTNAKFMDQFCAWLRDYEDDCRCGITVVNDGVFNESDRLGAVGDLQFVIDNQRIDDDVVVIAGDNLFTEPLTGFGDFCRQRNDPVVGVYDVGDPDKVRKYSVVHTDAQGRITFFEEKPAQPDSTLAAIALYYFPRRVLPRIGQYLSEGRNPDHSGRFIQWIYSIVPCYTWQVPGLWFDIGSPETLETARRLFAHDP